MDLLARREHSAHELRQKLEKREFDSDEIELALGVLQKNNLQSDTRFTESYVNHRINAGLGPVKIAHELRQRGVDSVLVDEHMSTLPNDWNELLERQRIKKYGYEIPTDYAQKIKQARFLQNRGFSPESVMRLFR
jgi:regulatory protein|tara:strand:- start:561 stop:965 length:405 start_codon:yes stop_codon:yes gene_type:complete